MRGSAFAGGPANLPPYRALGAFAAMEVQRGRMTSACDWGGRVLREGDQIVIDMPGFRPVDAERVKSIIGLHWRL